MSNTGKIKVKTNSHPVLVFRALAHSTRTVPSRRSPEASSLKALEVSVHADHGLHLASNSRRVDSISGAASDSVSFISSLHLGHVMIGSVIDTLSDSLVILLCRHLKWLLLYRGYPQAD